MLQKSKLLAGVTAAGAAIFSTGVLAADGKGSVYTDIRWSLNSADTNGAGPVESATNNNSYWGLSGSTSERGLTVFGAYENTLDNDAGGGNATRQGYAGVKSDFGTVKYGQFGHAYFDAGRGVDLFANTAVAGVVGPTAAGAAFNSHGTSPLTQEVTGAAFVHNQLSYTSPSFGGLTVNAAVFIDETAAPASGTDHDYGLGASYDMGSLKAGVQLLTIDNDGNFASTAPFVAPFDSGIEALRIHGGFNVSNMGVNASIEKVSVPGAADADFTLLSGWFGVAQGTRLAASLGSEHNTAAEGNTLTVGVFHDVIKDFTAWVAARRYDGKNATSGVQDDVLTVGASYKFKLGFGG